VSFFWYRSNPDYNDVCCMCSVSEVNAQSSVIESLVKVKERELALALMRVAELTRQLDQLRQGQLDGVLVDSTSSHAKLLDRNPQVSEIFSVFDVTYL